MKEKKYDILIVGSGLGGLICGNILALEGYRVCVLEKHNQIGGNLQTFKRDGCVFDTGMHYVGCLGKDEVLYKIFEYLNVIKKINIRRLDIDNFDIMDIGGNEYKMAQGYNNFAKTLTKYFPNEQKAIEKYVNDLQENWNKSPFLTLDAKKIVSIYDMFQEQEYSAFEYIDRLTDNKRLKAVLACNNGLYAGNSKKTPFNVLADINSFYIKSAWRLTKGGSQLALLLKQNIEKLEGKVLINKEVTEFNVVNKKIESVTVNNNEKYFSNSFISNIHPATTVDMFEQGSFRKTFTARIKNLENTISSFSLFIVLNKNTFEHINHNIYYSKNEDVWDINNNPNHKWPHGYILYTSANKNNKYAESITIVSMMRFDEVKQWENTTIEKRGDDYKLFKKQKAEKLIDLIEKRYPNIRSKIKKYYTASPLTYRDYTGTVNGSMYGIEKDYKNLLETYVPIKNKIPNLYFTGQNINIHGMLGVAMGSLITCSYFVNLQILMSKIKNSK